MERHAKRFTSKRRRSGLRARIARFVRALFSSSPGDDPREGEAGGGVGVREPRRPRRPNLSGAVALEAPPDEVREITAIGEDRD